MTSFRLWTKKKCQLKKKKVLWLWSHQPLQMPPSHGESDNSGWIKTGYWPWIVKMHIKGTTSMNPDSYIFSYVEKHKNHSLEMSSLVCVCVREREREISSNLWVLQYVCFFFFFHQKLRYSPYLTSLEQSLRAIWEAAFLGCSFQ